MAVAYDATSGANGTGTLSFTHTPVGTPRGVVVFVNQQAGSTVDQVTGVTYGGVAMTEVAGSPFTHTAGDEDAVMHAFFLGASIPTGAQTVQVSVDATGTGKRAQAVTVTAADDTSVDDTSTADIASTTTPSVTLTTSVETVVLGSLHTGVQNVNNIAPGADYTDLSEFSHGTSASSWIRRTTNPAAGSVTVDWTQNAEEAGILAVAVREGTGGGSTTPQALTATSTASVTFTNQVGKLVQAIATSDATVLKQVGKAVTANASSTASLVAIKVILKTVTATVAATATVGRQVGKVVQAAVSTTATATRLVAFTLAASVTAAGSVAKTVGKAIQAALTSAATLLGVKTVSVSDPYPIAAEFDEAGSLLWVETSAQTFDEPRL